MSQSFTISSVKAIKYNELQQHAGLDGLVFIKGYPAPKKNRWPKGHTLVYRNRVSVRPIDIHFDGHTFAVKIFAASSPEDYAVAISLIQAIISMGGGKVTPENSHEMGLATFKIHYNPAWVKNHSLKSFRNLMETYRDSKVPIKIRRKVRSDKGTQRKGVATKATATNFLTRTGHRIMRGEGGAFFINKGGKRIYRAKAHKRKVGNSSPTNIGNHMAVPSPIRRAVKKV